MAQKQEKAVIARLPEESVKAGKIRPYDKVKIEWIAAVGGKSVGDQDEVHPSLAAKLLQQGKAIIIDVEGDTSKVAEVTSKEAIEAAKKIRAYAPAEVVETTVNTTEKDPAGSKK